MIFGLADAPLFNTSLQRSRRSPGEAYVEDPRLGVGVCQIVQLTPPKHLQCVGKHWVDLEHTNGMFFGGIGKSFSVESMTINRCAMFMNLVLLHVSGREFRQAVPGMIHANHLGHNPELNLTLRFADVAVPTLSLASADDVTGPSEHT